MHSGRQSVPLALFWLCAQTAASPMASMGNGTPSLKVLVSVRDKFLSHDHDGSGMAGGGQGAGPKIGRAMFTN